MEWGPDPHGARARMLCVVGTRPEAIKLAPVIAALARHPRLSPVVLATGQHRELLAGALAEFGIAADIDLALMRAGQTPLGVLAAALPALAATIAAVAPAAVIVQGDTASAWAAAQAAAYAQVPVAHVEAGLRSRDRAAPFPEELHRRLIAQLASVHFAPTTAAAAALHAEGIAPATVHVTGNTGIDALGTMRARLAADAGLARRAAAALPGCDPRRPLIVATVHRRESHGAPLDGIAAALAEIAAAAAVEIVVPVHPHPAVGAALKARLAGCRNVHLIAPLGYAAFVTLLGRAALALTDSGGVQEEAPALGVPLLVLRDVTEREEGIASGNARLIGTARAAIVGAVHELLDDRVAHARMAEPALPYGDGAATQRIVSILAARFGPERSQQRDEAREARRHRSRVIDGEGLAGV